MNINKIEKKFEKKFTYGSFTFDGNNREGRDFAMQTRDEVKEFLRSEISALLNELKGEEIKPSIELMGEVIDTQSYVDGANQATQEFNQRIEEAKK